MTDRLTDHDDIRDVADQIMDERGDLTLEQLRNEFRVNDLEVSYDDLEEAVQR